MLISDAWISIPFPLSNGSRWLFRSVKPRFSTPPPSSSRIRIVFENTTAVRCTVRPEIAFGGKFSGVPAVDFKSWLSTVMKMLCSSRGESLIAVLFSVCRKCVIVPPPPIIPRRNPLDGPPRLRVTPFPRFYATITSRFPHSKTE